MGEPTVIIASRNSDSDRIKEEPEGEGDYPMDFYADQSLGEWTPRFGMGVKRSGGETGRPIPRRARVAVVA